MKQLFATTARGFEELLKTELTQLGALGCRIVQGGVHYQADMATMYRTLLHSRLSSRILLPLLEAKVFTDMDLYSALLNYNWADLFDARCTFLVDFNGTNDAIRHTQFGAMRVKDAVVDYFERHGKMRPNVDKNRPDIRLHAYLNSNKLVVSFDLSGDALHLRGYRTSTGDAPLRETLAAAIMLRSGWDRQSPLVDPMCGSGTLLIEAAQMACEIAPNLARLHWGFDFWTGHNQTIWQEVKAQAQRQAEQGMEKFFRNLGCEIWGFDLDKNVLFKAKLNAKQAGVEHLIKFQQSDIAELKNPTTNVGTVVCNPPYGERLSTSPALIALYSMLGQKLKSEFAGWQASIFSSDATLLDCLRLRSSRQFKAKNGQLDCIQKNYVMSRCKTNTDDNLTFTANTPKTQIASDFANRLLKNRKKIKKWANREGIEAYRLYDADLPEYNLAVDIYGDYVVIQEYAPPKNVDAEKARQRLLDAVNATLTTLNIETNKLILKVRQKQKGSNQYQKLAHKGEYFYVKEYNANLWVNLTDYLDTGLFLDHRLTRQMLGKLAKDKDFLNLFAYTGAGTVQAALGGAKSTTTVDMSYTYLNWAEQNLELNDISVGHKHRLIQADCLQWLAEEAKHAPKFDLIFVDPPTFSNSKRMEESWDVERDQAKLFDYLARILRPAGMIIFSNNKRHFKMDFNALEKLGLHALDISKKTLPLDFERNPKIHNCWQISWQKSQQERK